MKCLRIALVAAGLSSMSLTARADFSYATLDPSSAGLSLNGAASLQANGLNLTTLDTSAGSAFRSDAQVLTGGFDTTFSYNIFGGNGADGMAFVIQDVGPGALGSAGSGLGYQGISHALGIEFNTFSYGGIEVRSEGRSNFLGGTPPLAVRGSHTARINYTPGTFDVYLDDLITPKLTLAGFNLSNFPGATDASGAAYVGFSGATGGLNDYHTVQNWTFASSASVPEPGSLTLMGLGVAGLGLAIRRRR